MSWTGRRGANGHPSTAIKSRRDVYFSGETNSGQCAAIAKFKGPILRGLAARAPYFHNGSAATLLDAVNFHDQRFNIGFMDEQKADLVNFLKTL